MTTPITSNSSRSEPLQHVPGMRGGSRLALVGAALALGITIGWFKVRWSGSALVTTNELVSRVTRILCIAALCSTIAGLGHPKLKWHASAFMWWEWIDAHEHGLRVSAWSLLPATLCLISLVATQTRRNALAAWSIVLAGAVLAFLFVRAR